MSTRNLLFGITGGIAAYKAPLLVRAFQEQGVNVKAMVTRNALQFVTETTLAALTGQSVYKDTFDTEDSNFIHLELPRWAHVMLVAPATANCIAKFTWGVADDLLTTARAALKRPLIVAPAMNHDMWVSDATQGNVRRLQSEGVRVVRPESGYLACVQQGAGRMAAIEKIVECTMQCFEESDALRGKRVLVTAGATREPIDPVRFITNRSSGKMGYAVAAALLRYGASVTLVSGPTDLLAPQEVETVQVTTAADMFHAVSERAPECDIIIKAAAVADYTPAAAAEHKIKKSGDGITLELARTQDILAHLGQNKRPGQLLVGFSAETQNHVKNAAGKLKKKNLDLIVLNDVAAADAGFGVDTNRVILIWPENAAAPDPEFETMKKNADGVPVTFQALPLLTKIQVADRLVQTLIRMLAAQ